MTEKKTYTVITNKRAARPRSERLRDLGTAGVSSSGSVSETKTTVTGDGHTHNNKPLLDSLSRDDDGYLYMDPSTTEDNADTEDDSRQKVNAGEADKIKDDTYKEILHTLKGIDSENFEADSTGMGIYEDADGNWHIDADFFNVRKKLTAKDIEVQHWSHVGGVLAVTSAGMIVKTVETSETYYRCYFETTDADGRTVYNLFTAGDGAYCETFNLTKQADGTLGNHFFWRRVVAVGDNYIDLSITDCGSGSDVPKPGDSIEQLGNTTNTDRQGAIIVSALGTGAPCIKIYDGITGFTLPESLTKLGPKGNKITGEFVSSVTGENIDDTLETITKGLDDVTEQADRCWILWIETEEPTLLNSPAVDWTTDILKKEHVKDIVMIKDSSVSSKNGRAWRFSETDNGDGTYSYSWEEITDQYLLDALKLANAKRRTFVAQPTDDDEYDVGDLWTNATWLNADGSYLYENDILRCVTAKIKGTAFSISDWTLATKYSSALIKSEDDRVLLAATNAAADASSLASAANSLANSAYNEAYAAYNKAVGAQSDADSNSQSIATLRVDVNSVVAVTEKLSFDSSGNVVNIDKSGLVLTSDFATLFSTQVDSEGIAKTASMRAYVDNAVSNIDITADNVSIGGTNLSNIFTVMSWGTSSALVSIVGAGLYISPSSGESLTVNCSSVQTVIGNTGIYCISASSSTTFTRMSPTEIRIQYGGYAATMSMDLSKLIFNAIFPTSSSGLASHTVWSDNGTLKVTS